MYKALGIKKLVLSAMFLALCLVLPFLTGQIPQIGSMLSPMHIPVMLCGFICGWPWGLVVGLISPLLRFVLFSMPPIMTAIPMAFELAVYGAFCGLLYDLLPKKVPYIYVSLIVSMILGRVVWGAVKFALAGLGATQFSFELFISGAVVTAIPGIILHIVLVPLIVIALRKTGLLSYGRTGKNTESPRGRVSEA